MTRALIYVHGHQHKPPAEALTSYAERTGTGLVIVGGTSQHRLRDTLLGSVAERVVRRAPCSVLVVR